MKLIIDTREQLPLEFERDEIVTDICRDTLNVGDYGAEYTDGSRCEIFFERKSIGDLFGTLTTGHKRFHDELVRAKDGGKKLILAIEGTVQDVLRGSQYSQVSGQTILKKLMTLWLKYDLTPMFFASRKEMTVTIKEFYLAYGRRYKTRISQ